METSLKNENGNSAHFLTHRKISNTLSLKVRIFNFNEIIKHTEEVKLCNFYHNLQKL